MIITCCLSSFVARSKESRYLGLWPQVQVPLSLQKRCVCNLIKKNEFPDYYKYVFAISIVCLSDLHPV